MNYACINQWDGLTWPVFKEKVLGGNYDKVILFGQNEWAWYYQNPEFYEVLEYCKERNIPIEILTAACEENYPNTMDYVNVPMDYVNVHWWDTYWIGKTYKDLIGNAEHTGLPPRSINPHDDVQHEYHFISMNNRPHQHRCLFLDLMAKHDLMQYGALTVRHEDPIMYKWRYFDFRRMYLSDGIKYDQYKLPNEYFNSFAQLISESSGDVQFISEKTATPLILGKPFLVAGASGFHSMLQRMGFELYDEIFDYSFDSEPDNEKRYDMIMKNFVRLCRTPINKLNRLRKQVAHKVMRNKNRAREITYDLNLYPKIALDTINYYKETGIELDHRLIQNYLDLERYKNVKL